MSNIKKNKIAICCDLNSKTGLGHINRMKSLANEFNKKKLLSFFLFNDLKKNLKLNLLKNYNLIIDSKKKVSSDKNIFDLIIKKKFKIVLIDSYIFSQSLEKKLVENKIFTIVIDDHLKERFANLVFSNRTDVLNCIAPKKNQKWLYGNKYVLIEKIQKKNKKKKIPQNISRILLHAGGSSHFKKISILTNVTLEIVQKYNLKLFILCTNIDSKKYILKKLNKYDLSKNIYFIKYKEKLSNQLSKYDIVVGPAGTTTFEAIQSKTLPFSIPIKDDGRDSIVSWNDIGHLMHLNAKEKNKKEIILESWEYIIKNFNFLYNILYKNSKIIDGKGPERVVNDIISSIKKKNKVKTKFKKKKFEICGLLDMRPFLESRNLKQVRLFSSQPKHIISWPEHVNWWHKKNIKKYRLVISNKVVAYHWVKINSDLNGDYLTSGWFLSKEYGDNLRNSDMILNFQSKIVKNNYKNLTWIITMSKKNSFVERLNRKYGFKNATNFSIERVFKQNGYLKKNFKVMEMKL